MPEDRWQRVIDVLGAALERPVEAREAFLKQACGGDDALRREVESLLAARDEAGDFLDEPARLEEDGASSSVSSGRSPKALTGPGRLAAGTRLGPYEVVSFLGAGGMGEVYKGRDTRLDRTVAIKVLTAAAATHPDLHKRFEREARTISQLSHPHICALYDVGQHDGASFLVMEYLEGETLAQRLGKGPLPLEEALGYARQIAEALEEAHQQGVVHRDLKPANVVLTRKGAKLLDFGIAKLHSTLPAEDESARSRTLTREGLVVGTLQYMAPEQLEGRTVDERSDVFAFGLVLYEMVSGRKAFEAPSEPGLMAAILKDEPVPLSQVQPLAPPSLEALVQRCLAKDPEARWPSAGALLSALKRLEAGSPPARPLRLSRRAGLAAALAGGLVLALLAGLNLWSRFGAAAPRTASVAVLPFDNLSGDPAQEYFVDGMTDALIGDLARLPDLKVISRTSVMRFKEEKKPLAEIARELGVERLVEGATVWSAARVRVSARLVDPASGRTLWGETYDRAAEDVLRLQGELAASIAERVQANLSTELRSRLGTDRAVEPEVYRLYLKALHDLHKFLVGPLQAARAGFERVIDADPSYAPAHAGLAEAYLRLDDRDALPAAEARAKAKAAARKALDLDPFQAEAYGALCHVALHEWEWLDADAACRRVIALKPGYVIAHVNYAAYLAAVGQLEQALAEARRAQELDPLSPLVARAVSSIWQLAGRRDEALAAWRQRVASQPDNALYLTFLGSYSLEAGRFREAIAALEKAVFLAPDDLYALSILGAAYAGGGRITDARAVLARLQEAERGGTAVPPANFARVYIWLGDRDRAFQWLERAFQERATDLTFIKVDPEFDPVRDDPRLRELMRRMGLPE